MNESRLCLRVYMGVYMVYVYVRGHRIHPPFTLIGAVYSLNLRVHVSLCTKSRSTDRARIYNIK